MRIIISSLQVSEGASKGHLHPAIEIGLAFKRRGHEVGILPLPAPLSKKDRQQIDRCQFELIEPPPLPKGIILLPEQLEQLAKNPLTTSAAYHSFLVAPLQYQFEQVIEKIKAFNPDILIYDLLVYAAPMAARMLGIPDIGYCAGLKLIAPSSLTKVYQSAYQVLAPDIHRFLDKYSLTANFHQLELLSSNFQFVFTPENFIKNIETMPSKTILAGSLPINTLRCEPDNSVNYPDRHYVILCFGSVFDPANFPAMTNIIIKIAQQFNLHLIISTQKPHLIPLSDNITTASYLPLPQLLKKASIFIHHGGANTFSESLSIGVPQILIPLATDQPIQAELLKQSQAGIAIYPDDITEENIHAAFQQLLDKNNAIHQCIQSIKQLFEKSTGAENAANLIESFAMLHLTRSV